MSQPFYTRKLNAGTLYLVLAFSLVIAITLSMLILLRYYYSFIDKRSDVTIRLIKNVASGWEYVKAKDKKWTEERLTIDLFERGSDTVMLHINPWGVYHVVTVEAIIGKQSKRQSALFGCHSDATHRYAIRLAGLGNTKLKVMGETMINGDVMVPSSAVIPAFYDGKPFEGDKVVNGRVLEAEPGLPEVDGDWLAYVRGLLHHEFENDSAFNYYDSLRSNPFSSPMAIMISDEAIELTSALTNNVIVYSSTGITVDSRSALDGVLLVAPLITIQDSVKGSFQAFASTRIEVGDGVKLSYPSALVVVEENVASALSIGSAIIQGSVIMIGNEDTRIPKLTIREGAHVVGEVFAEGDVELYGDITGSIVCNRFIFNKGGELRENALWNVTIDGTRLPKNLVFSAIHAEKSFTDIACRL